MKKILSFGILLLAVIIISNAQSSGPQANKKEKTDAPEITFENFEYDYGTIKRGSDGTAVFSFTNTGKEPLILSEVKATCGCTTPSWTKEPVLRKKQGEIVAVYNTNIVGSFSKTIIVHSNAITSPVVLTIKGTVTE
jgi:hypothetical protein